MQGTLFIFALFVSISDFLIKGNELFSYSLIPNSTTGIKLKYQKIKIVLSKTIIAGLRQLQD
jgi:hypothetical protein